MPVNVLDWCTAAALVGGLALGYRRGLIGQLVSVAGLVIAYLVAYKYYDDVSPWIGQWIPWPSENTGSIYGFAANELNLSKYLNNAVAFAALLIGVKLVCSGIGAVLSLIFKMPGLNFINKWSGALLGLAEAALLIAVAVYIMTAIPSDKLQQQLADSQAAGIVRQYLPAIGDSLHDVWPQQQMHDDKKIQV